MSDVIARSRIVVRFYFLFLESADVSSTCVLDRWLPPRPPLKWEGRGRDCTEHRHQSSDGN